MGRHAVIPVLLLAAFGVLFSSCSPTGPSNNSQTSASTPAKLQFVSLSVSGVDVTVTNIWFQARSGSNLLAAASITPMSSVSANSMGNTTFVFTSDRHVQVSTLVANVTVYFRDAKGNAGSIAACLTLVSGDDSACWDY
jgi:hypothetical protein